MKDILDHTANDDIRYTRLSFKTGITTASLFISMFAGYFISLKTAGLGMGQYFLPGVILLLTLISGLIGSSFSILSIVHKELPSPKKRAGAIMNIGITVLIIVFLIYLFISLSRMWLPPPSD